MRPRVDVLAADAADVVNSAGGWLFERAWAGWQVTVFLAEHGDARPLRILGARVAPLESALTRPQLVHKTFLVAAAAELAGSHHHVRARLDRALKDGDGHVIVWGDTWPVGLDRRVEKYQHRLSPAALAFKAHALQAASVNEPVIETEQFRCRMKSVGASDWDLSRIG